MIYPHMFAVHMPASRMRYACRQDIEHNHTTRNGAVLTIRETVHTIWYACPTAVSAHMRCAKGAGKGSAPASVSTLWPEGATCRAHLLRGAISHPRSSAGGHWPLMMRLTVSLSLHSATFCFPMVAQRWAELAPNSFLVLVSFT